MRTWNNLGVTIAFPGSLGYPPPPAGWLYLIDDRGNYLTDGDGVFLIVPEIGS